MSQYDLQELDLKRQRMIAQALRDSGNFAPQELNQTAGGYVIPVSPWAAFGKIANSLTGALGDYEAGKGEQKLQQQKSDDAKQWMTALSGIGNDPTNQLQPVVPTSQPMFDPNNPSTVQDAAGIAQMHGANQQAALDDYGQRMTKDRNDRMALYLKGLDLGGVPAALSQHGLERIFTPKVYDPIKVGEGDKVIDPNTGTTIAQGNPKTYKPTTPAGFEEIVDPTAPNGHRTITAAEAADRIAKGEQLQRYYVPQANPTGELTDAQEKQAQTIAKAVYEYRMPMPSLSTRNPVPARVAELVQDMSSRDGEDYRAFEYNARSKALNAFSTGKQGQTVRSFNVMIDHLHTLENEYGKLNNGDVQAINYWKNKFKEQFGAAAPPTVETLKNMVRGELVKAVTGGPGAESDRAEALKSALGIAQSPDQVHTALSGIRELAASQLKGLNREFTSTTNLSNERFNRYLSPAALEILQNMPENMGDLNKDTPPKDAPALPTSPTVTSGGFKITRVK